MKIMIKDTTYSFFIIVVVSSSLGSSEIHRSNYLMHYYLSESSNHSIEFKTMLNSKHFDPN